MSGFYYFVVPAAACFDERLTPIDVRVLDALCHYGAYRNSGAWPSYNTLAEKMRVSRRTVIRSIKVLCDCDYVVKQSTGQKGTNNYRVNLDIETNIDDAKVVTPMSPTGDTHVTPTSDTHVTQTNTNNNNKNKKYIKKKDDLDLHQWEDTNGELSIKHLSGWINKHGLCEKKVERLIEEYRDVVISRRRMLKDFAADFRNFVRKGWLGKKEEDLKPDKDQSHYEVFGNSI